MRKVKYFLAVSLSLLFVNDVAHSTDTKIINNEISELHEQVIVKKIPSYTFTKPAYPIIYYPYPMPMYQANPVNPSQYQALFDPNLGWWLPIPPPRLPCPFDDRGGCRAPVGAPVGLGGYTQYYFPQHF